MPSRNIVRSFAEQSYYHVYNRGVEKRVTFLDDQDYQVFLSILKIALSPDAPEELIQEQHINTDRLRRIRVGDEVKLLAYCLMPNHFHLFLYQESVDGVKKLMHSLGTAYTAYFNKRYERVGSLFQGTYKASPIVDDSYYWHIARYIHLNPLDLSQDYKTYPYSSLRHIGADIEWLSNDLVEMFGGARAYLRFVADHKKYIDSLDRIRNMLADS